MTMSRFLRRPFAGRFGSRRGPARFEGLVASDATCTFRLLPDRTGASAIFESFRVIGPAADAAAGPAELWRGELAIGLAAGARGIRLRTDLYGHWDGDDGGGGATLALIVAGRRHDIAIPAERGEAIDVAVEGALPAGVALLRVAVEARVAEPEAMLTIESIIVTLLS